MRTGSSDESVGRIRPGGYGESGRRKDQRMCLIARGSGAGTGEGTLQFKSREFLLLFKRPSPVTSFRLDSANTPSQLSCDPA